MAESNKILLKDRLVNFPTDFVSGTKAVAVETRGLATKLVRDLKNDFLEIIEDIKTEFFQSKEGAFKANLITLKDQVLSFIHIPFLPAFHSPGWLLRYIVGPHDRDWIDSIVADIGAGLTVGLTLIPQVMHSLFRAYFLRIYSHTCVPFHSRCHMQRWLIRVPSMACIVLYFLLRLTLSSARPFSFLWVLWP